jgi:hypothetical protein
MTDLVTDLIEAVGRLTALITDLIEAVGCEVQVFYR